MSRRNRTGIARLDGIRIKHPKLYFCRVGASLNYNDAMPSPSTRDHGRQYVAYFCLLLLFAIAVTDHIRTAANSFGILLDSNQHVRDPFEIDGLEMELVAVQAESRAAGIRDGDHLAGIRGQTVQGFTDFYSILREARPGERLPIQGRSSAPGATLRDISIELQSAFPNGPQASHWLHFALEDLAMPVVCFALGFWVAMVRIRDKLACCYLCFC